MILSVRLLFEVSARVWKSCLYMLLQEEDAVTLGLSTGQALAKLRDQLSNLLEQHQRAARRRVSAQVHIHIYIGAR